ncbi:MAG: hypothetical protein J1G01_04150 [Clostridiales bacterium]|nr:hypothetical protein [Clostridiales bacterium]
MNFSKAKKKYTTARLYIEDYNHYTGELWLDFINANEFCYFNSMGDSDSIEQILDRYIPSMIYVRGIGKDAGLRHGSVLEVPMDRLSEFRSISKQRYKEEQRHEEERRYEEERYEVERRYEKQRYEEERMYEEERYEEEQRLPADVNMTVGGEAFLNLLNSESTKRIDYLSDFVYDDLYIAIGRLLNRYWEGPPCNLDKLKKSFDVKIWDVGQGNTNSISDGTNLTLFDIGCSKHFNKQEQQKIWNNHLNYVNAHDRPTLIISHWDVDHFNMLSCADDEFIKNLCCAFVPTICNTVMAKQLLYKLTKSCKYVRLIEPMRRDEPRHNHLHEIYKGTHFTMYTGECSTSKNNSGLALHVFGQNVSVFLTADHSNSQICDDMYNHYITNHELNIVVPHHGARCGVFGIPNSCNNKSAIISVGKNSYKHPLQEVIDNYTAAGFEVLRTDWERKDIDIKVH